MSGQTVPILLIEDDLSLRESLRHFFEDGGHPTAVATSRLEGEELLRRFGGRGHGSTAPICLLDLNLPDGSGLDLIRLIVQERLAIRVIVMSAFPIQHLRGRFPESVLVAMMTKPVSPQHLLDVVDKITSGGGAAGAAPQQGSPTGLQ